MKKLLLAISLMFSLLVGCKKEEEDLQMIHVDFNSVRFVRTNLSINLINCSSGKVDTYYFEDFMMDSSIHKTLNLKEKLPEEEYKIKLYYGSTEYNKDCQTDPEFYFLLD